MERVGRLQLLAGSSTLLVGDECKLLVHLRLELASPCVLLPLQCQELLVLLPGSHAVAVALLVVPEKACIYQGVDVALKGHDLGSLGLIRL